MSTTLLDSISAGRVIDEKFPLLRELGRTEWTSAWLTEIDDGRVRKAAIKIFPSEAVDACTTMAPWDLAATLSHPHLMPLLCAGRCELDGGDLLYVVTECADEVLSQILPERSLSPEETLEMLRPILSALSYLHMHGLAHGHLRPTNIMVIDDQLKLSPDFGWCSRTQNIYDPPEAGTCNVAPTTDIWSLGILLVEALTQQPPVWDRSQGCEPEIPATIREPFSTICRECLRIDPERRCTLAGIKAHLNPPRGAESAVRPADPIVEPTNKSNYKFRAMVLAGVVLVPLSLIGAFEWGWNLTPSPPMSTAHLPVAPPPDTAATRPLSAAPTPEPAPTPAPATASTKSGMVKGSVTLQVLPHIPGTILGAIRGHVKVGIRVEVDTEGNVYQASIDSLGPSRYFADKALHAAQGWKFTPAQFDGSATDSTWYLQFQFGQSQSVVTPTEEFP
jgi:serine/threonine protein kinase